MENILTLIISAITYNIIVTAIIQKIKKYSFIKHENQILIINLLLSLLGIFFGMTFYKLPLLDSLWMPLFTFAGAPALYIILKNQTIIKYKPKSLQDFKKRKDVK